ncbi:hypothetical protein [Candidatus Leptofilum sp.]|uniref:hypothetical protein n=1 Tax=Candidatus Leptofilum sp. TaxID=3241576 RepID=UPI003B5AC27E
MRLKRFLIRLFVLLIALILPIIPVQAYAVVPDPVYRHTFASTVQLFNPFRLGVAYEISWFGFAIMILLPIVGFWGGKKLVNWPRLGLLLVTAVLLTGCTTHTSGITISSRQMNMIASQNNTQVLQENHQENLMTTANQTAEQSGFRRYLTPIIATVIYFILGLVWLFSFGLLMLSIAPEEQPMTYISMLVYAVVVLPALIFSFVYAGRGEPVLALRAALVPLLPGAWVIVSWILLFIHYA